MILQITIKNFAIIKNIEIDFLNGLSVFTGETGAGKSIVIDSINFVLGHKVSKDIIRKGADKVFVEAIFSIDNDKQREFLDSHEIEYDDYVIITREYSEKKNFIKINGRTLLFSEIKIFSSLLIDYNAQKENNKLLDSNIHIDYLDKFLKDKSILEKIRKKYIEYTEVNRKINELVNLDNTSLNIDFLEFQINEIENVDLKDGEEENISERLKFLNNCEKINKTYRDAYNTLNGESESDSSVLKMVNNMLQSFKMIENVYSESKTIADIIEESYYNLEEAASEIAAYDTETFGNENELFILNNRMSSIFNLKKKYGSTYEEINEYKNSTLKKLEEFKNRNSDLLKLEELKSTLEKEMDELNIILLENRKEAASYLEKRIIKELHELELQKCLFKIEIVSKEKYTMKGNNEVRFLISTNVGSEPKAIDKIASGGELSRIILALKVVFADFEDVPTLIFDEIDTGISGKVAQSTSEKIFDVSMYRQVFSITHLPQMAAMSDNHYHSSKVEVDNMTESNIKLLDSNEKLNEVAIIISGNEITESSIKAASDLINNAEEYKTRRREEKDKK